MLVDPFFFFFLVTFDTYHHYEIENNENMNRSTFHKLDDEFKFGKYQGSTFRKVLQSDPGYIRWCLENLTHFKLSSDLIDIIRSEFPTFSGNNLLEEHRYFEPDIYEEEDDYYDRDSGYYEEQHYEEFAGTYVQDEMGWSDEMIYDALDGDPDAYWNID